MKKELKTREGLLKKSDNAYKRARIKDNLSTFFAFLGLAAVALGIGSGISAAGVGMAADSLLNKYAQTAQYQVQLQQDTEIALSSENITDSIKELNSEEYKEKVLYESGDKKLIKKYDRLKKAGNGLLITFIVSAGQILVSWPGMKLAERSQEKDESRAINYKNEAYLIPKEDEKNESEEEDSEAPIEN